MAKQFYRRGSDLYDAQTNQRIGPTAFGNGAGYQEVQIAPAKGPDPISNIARGPDPIPDVARGPRNNDPQPVATPPSVIYNADGTRQAVDPQAEIDSYFNGLKPKTAAEIAKEEQAIRDKRFVEQQQAIEGTNQVYNNLLAQINTDNKSRLGSVATITANSGERGSASGAATESNTRTANQKVVDANEQERLAKISLIMSNYQNKISDEIAQARELRTKDANAYIQYKAGEIDRNKAKADELRKTFIASGTKPEDLTDDVYKEIATKGGYTIEQAKALYKSEYDSNLRAFTQAEEKRQAEAAKTAAETANLNASANKNSQANIMIDKGYSYVSTPEERDKLKKSGRITVDIDGKTYVAPSTLKTEVIVRGGNSILINKETGEDIKNLGPTATKVSKGAGSKNYTSTTIPGDVKKDLLGDKGAGASVDELMAAYPEVSTSYIQSLYRDPNSGFDFGDGNQ